MTDGDWEPIFATRSAAEERRAEQALAAERITYTVSLEATEPTGSSTCFLGTVYAVAYADAERARRVLIANGLSVGILDHGERP